MVGFIPSPDLSELLPPLLAHLPLGYSSAKAPPSLLPLLSPILRSRLQLLEGTEETWLALLTWSATNSDGESLVDHLKQQDLTPHECSGEVEIGDYDLLGIKRVDAEMLEARAVLRERKLLVRFVWVTSDSKEESEGWKVLEVEVLHGEGYDEGDEGKWFTTVDQAESAFARMMAGHSDAEEDEEVHLPTRMPQLSTTETVESEDDDADYWARYDCGGGESPDPAEMAGAGPSEDEYFSRYGQMDSQIGDGPEPEVPDIDTFIPLKTKQPIPQYPISFHSNMVSNLGLTTYSSSSQSASETSTPPTSFAVAEGTTEKTPVQRSRKPSDASERSSVTSETGIKQHISTSIKSLYRLARSGGIEAEEFERLVKVELGLLSMMELEDQ